MHGPLISGGRRRRRTRGLLVAVVAAAVGLGIAAWQLRPDGTSASGAPPASSPVSPSGGAAAGLSAAPRAPRLLIARQPLQRLPGGITARAGIVVDQTTGTVIYAKHAHLRLPIASTTKIMTAVVAMELLRPRDVVIVDPAATRVTQFKEGLRAGERVPAWKLFYGLMLVSGNDTALALAIQAAGTRARFLALMNAKARALGLLDTHFTTPSGLIDRGNYSTAWDLAALARYAMWNPRFRAVVRTRRKRVSWSAPTYAKVYENHNKLLRRYAGADGIKTGWTTKAGNCLVASAHRHGIRVIAVVLDSPDHYGDVSKLLDLGFANRG